MGLESVQPKQISPMGQPLVTEAAPVATAGAVESLANAFRQGFVTTEDIAERMRNQPVVEAKRKVELQAAQEAVSPEAVEARRQQQRLAGAKALGEHETLLSKDFVGAYLRYNLPLKKKDGTPDYTGMAEVGQKYADFERQLKYAEMGLAGKPVTSLDRNNNEVTRVYNVFNEDITQTGDKPNRTVQEYQKMARKARMFLLQNDKEPEVPEGGTPPKIEVSPRQGEPFTPESAPVEPAATFTQFKENLPPFRGDPKVPKDARGWLYESGVLPQSVALNLTDQEAVDIYQSFREKLNQPTAPEVVAKAPTIQPPQAKPVVDVPAAPTEYAGEGMVTKRGLDPDKFVTDQRAVGLYKNWEEKKPQIDAFRGIVEKYKTLPHGSITTQNDIDLATTALLLTTSGQSAGGRGMEGMRITKLEESQPLVEQLTGLKGHLFKEHKFEEGTRKRIIEAVERRVQAIEAQGRSVVKNAADRLAAQGFDPTKYLVAPELELLKVPAPGAAAGAPGENVKVIGGKKYQPLGNGLYRALP